MQFNNIIKANKTILLRTIGVILLAWVCYIPEVKPDLANVYVESGVLSEASSRGYTSTTLNNKLICITVSMFGCFSSIKNSWELKEILKNKTPVEVFFASDMGNAMGAMFLNRSLVIEIRQDGKAIPSCSKEEMLNNLHQPHWFYYLISIFSFLFFLPLIFNLNFYHNFLNSFSKK